MSGEWISVLGIVVGLALLMFLAVKGYTILLVAPLCAIIVGLFSGADIGKALGWYGERLGSFAGSVFLLFVLGAVFGKYMEDSGAARVIARQLLRWIGKGNPFLMILGVALVGSVLTYGGVILFVAIFAVLPIARTMFKELNVPWHLVMPSLALGMATFTMTMLPGSPSLQNMVPSIALGTQLTAAPLVGITAAVVTVLFAIWYIYLTLKKAQARGETYEGPISGVVSSEKEPGLMRSFLPLILLLIVLNVLPHLGPFKDPERDRRLVMGAVMVLGLLTGIIAAAIAFRPFIKKQADTVYQGSYNAVIPLINTISVVGFGGVIERVPGFESIKDMMLNMPGGPLISLSIAGNVIAGVIGSAVGGLGITLTALAPTYLEIGVHPEVIHRIAAIATGGLDALPHNGMVLAALTITGLTFKQAYRHIFVCAVIAPILGLVAAVLVATALY